MRIALRTARLGASHAIAGVGVLRDVVAVGGGIETRPSGSRIKLGFRTKKQSAAAHAVVRSVVVLVPALAGEGALGAAGAGHLILLGSKLGPPLGLGLRDLVAEFVGHVVSPQMRCGGGAKVAKAQPASGGPHFEDHPQLSRETLIQYPRKP